jgi:myo-inositol-1(or 4)-monophosphatase
MNDASDDPASDDPVAPATATADPDTPADPHAADLAFAIDLVRNAGDLVRQRFGDSGEVTYKGSRDIVTEVDHAAEALIRAAIATRFPGDAFYGEETGRDATRADRVWICDPVDGTINFANGIPWFCVSLALAERGRPAVGVILDPMRGDLWAATSYGPTALNGHLVGVSVKERLVDYVLSLAVSGRAPATRTRRVRRAIRIPRTMGSAALALAGVAGARFDAFAQTGGLSIWDIAAAGLIAERAGARVTDMRGGPWFDLGAPAKKIGILAAPPAHHGRLLELLREG